MDQVDDFLSQPSLMSQKIQKPIWVLPRYNDGMMQLLL